MAAVAQQGNSLGSFLVGFTALVAGLVAGSSLGAGLALVGLGFMLYAGYGFRKVKSA